MSAPAAQAFASAGTGGPLLVVDAPSILYRMYFAMPKDMLDQAGRPIGAVRGFLRFVAAEADSCDPRAVVICFGAEEANYRVELLPAYHADREPMPDELRVQFELAAELSALLGWRVSQHPALEADDLLGAFAALEHAAQSPALLLTGDRDLFQCVTAHVSVRFPQGREKGTATVDAAAVADWVGVAPGQVPELIALRGDPSDGIPGAPGIGAKTAAALLGQYGTLERVIAQAEAVAAGRERPVSPLSQKRAEDIAANASLIRVYLKVAQLQPVDVQRPASAPTDWASGATAARERGLVAVATDLERRVTARR